MNMIHLVAQTPVTNQMQHDWNWTWLYWIPLPLILVFALRAGYRQRQQQGPLKKLNAARVNSLELGREQERLKAYRKFIRENDGMSPVGGKTAEQALADQEALVRSLLEVQSDLHSDLPEGGRGPYQPPEGR